jgi:hypothetical protein
MANVPRSAARASIDCAVQDNAAANSGSGLDEKEMLDPRPELAVLGQRHEINVIVDQGRNAEFSAKKAADVKIVPSSHDGWTHDAPSGVVDRRRKTEADPKHPSLWLSATLQKLSGGAYDLGQRPLRSARNVEIDSRLRDDARRDVRRRDTNHAFSNVGSQRDGEPGICPEHASGAPAASLNRVAFDDETGFKKVM